jgi:inosose dehydratase
MAVLLANAPVSWGVDVPDKPGAPAWADVYREISQAGYRWCELGPRGYLPEDDEKVRAELDTLGLRVAGSFIFEPVHDPSHHEDVAAITRGTCARIAGLGGRFLVVIDMVSEERDATAGRGDRAPRLDGAAYGHLLDGLRRVIGIAGEHGLTPVLHPHAGTYIEFEDEIARVLDDTADDGLQLCIDTGHLAYAGIDPVGFFASHRARVLYLHFKDVDAGVHAKVLRERIPFFDAISHGVFCPLGRGMVDFVALAAELASGFDGPGTVEQDRDPSADTTPLQDAVTSREFLESLGLADT